VNYHSSTLFFSHTFLSNLLSDLIEYLLSRGADPTKMDRRKLTPLMHAQLSGHVLVVEMLRAHAADAGADTHTGAPSAAQLALCVAAATGDAAEICKLVASAETSTHIDVNASTFDRRSPLHLACAAGFVDACKALLAAGANPLAADVYVSAVALRFFLCSSFAASLLPLPFFFFLLPRLNGQNRFLFVLSFCHSFFSALYQCVYDSL
jgi:ankyrin repeat protein